MSRLDWKLPVLVFGIAMIAMLPGPKEAEASDGLCAMICQRSFASCLWEAGCRRNDNCRDGSRCSGGYCADGSRCGELSGCDPTACIDANRECLAGCVDWLTVIGIPDYLDLVKIDPVIRDSLKDRLRAAVLDAVQGVDQARYASGQQLRAFRAEVDSLVENQKIDAATAWTLNAAAGDALAQLSSASLCDAESGEPLLGARDGKQPVQQMTQE